MPGSPNTKDFQNGSQSLRNSKIKEIKFHDKVSGSKLNFLNRATSVNQKFRSATRQIDVMNQTDQLQNITTGLKVKKDVFKNFKIFKIFF